MSVLRRVAHNTALQFIGKAGGTALGFGTAVLLLRYLGDTQFGYYTSALAYLQLFGILMDLGLYIVLLKKISDVSSPHNQRLINNIFSLRSVTAVLFLTVACSLVWFIPQYPPIVQWAVVVVAANFFFITMNQLLLGVYQKELATGIVAIAEIISKLVLLIGTAVVIYIVPSGLLVLMLIVVLSGTINFVILLWHVKRYLILRWEFDWTIWKQLLQESWPVALSIGLNLIYFKADTVLLGLFQSQTAVGIYGAPYKMLEVIITLPAMIVGLVMPMMNQAFSGHRLGEFKNLYQRTCDGLVMIALPLVIGTIVVAHPLMRFVAGEKFTSEIDALGTLLQILMVAVGMIFLGTLTGYLAVIVNQQRAMLWGYAFVAVTALAAYLWAIPRYSYYGAAAVTVYSETAIMLIGFALIYRATHFLPNVTSAARAVLASAVMGITVWYCSNLPIWLTIGIGVLVYVIVLTAVGGITLNQLKSLMQRRTHA
ncbi:MAG: flippase [Candidatus Kerfeldbacteria bacterium]|nr:flippase [Candidatus Kerfeldbacteria bacterium]